MRILFYTLSYNSVTIMKYNGGMETRRKPLKRSIFIFTLGFITIMCLFLSVVTYTMFTRSIYRAYDKRMLDILNYVESHIDVDDLSVCVETGVESEKYFEMMGFMDSIMEDFNIHYLYIVKPVLDEGVEHGMMNIFSADTAEGRENDPDGYYLDCMLYDEYEEEELLKYQDAIESDETTYFKNFTYWGYDYTAARPLINNEGEHFALLCVDIEVQDVKRAIQAYTFAGIVVIFVMGIMFLAIFVTWMNHNMIEPVRRLEKSVVNFAKKSHAQANPDKLDYEDPQIHTRNEVESLADAVSKMTLDMRNYVKSILEAENRVEDMRTQVSQMDVIAYQDALTHVKNKAWYDKTKIRVDDDIAAGRARFGIIMADLNRLKYINDNYGHEHGNDYIAGACHHICIIFNHSPVFRIGGDEFVVLLENQDYDNREALIGELKAAFRMSSIDESVEPWNRYSVAIGVSLYNPTIDESMNDVFRRADELMYQDKLASRQGRE